MSFLSKLIDKRIAEYQNGLIKTHYSEVENMYRQMRGWRHDYRSHIQTLKSHASAGELDEIIQYLDMLDTELSSIDIQIKTGNRMTDAILNSKISLAKSKNIFTIVEADISLKLTTSELDLCVIIGNLFDNAIEANLSLPQDKRMIRVYMDMKNTQLYMSFTNMTASKKQRKENGIFRTSKGEGHGFGLVRIDNIVERYGGYITRNSEDGAYTTEVLLPQ